MALLDQIQAFLSSALGMSATVALVLEFVLRMIPSQKPVSVLHVVGEVSKKVGAIFIALGGLLDKVLPQNVKPQA